MTELSKFKTNAWKERAAADTYHDATAAADIGFQIVRRDLYLKYFQEFSQKNQKILDVGCGSGLMAIALHDLGYRVTGCDSSEGMLGRFAVEKGDRDIDLRLGSGYNIPAEDNEFDAVISRMFIQHFADWTEILREKARVTKIGGIIYYDFGNSEHIRHALRIEDPELGFPYSTDPTNIPSHYAVCDEETITRVAGELNLEVVSIRSHGLLVANAQLWQEIGAVESRKFLAEASVHLKNPAVADFMMFLEEKFVSRMPKSISYGNITVLRKLGDPIATTKRGKLLRVWASINKALS
ncbi:class I SAM-dependent methyltransferase [Rhizobium tumorigenes]|uniref:class I SAM-dependent methyltransferase n=1 Tax=Rhizobium tumorigenes TaxID=2041385 RepID=UPI00241C23BE|nr:class I SAM-dependent methyltransferase [Rhizobium tumorigenes]WFS03289.1 class I SAM-dependent methyltransferase [Rhizobium tumorigenes]